MHLIALSRGTSRNLDQLGLVVHAARVACARAEIRAQRRLGHVHSNASFFSNSTSQDGESAASRAEGAGRQAVKHAILISNVLGRILKRQSKDSTTRIRNRRARRSSRLAAW
jgi:hypothetical protein